MQEDGVEVLPKTVRMRVNRVPLQERRQGGRGSYHPELVSEVAELFMSGWSDMEVAEHVGISVRQLHRWKHMHADFAAAVAINDKSAVERVKGAFFAKATGFHYVEEQAVKVKTGEHTEAVEVVQVTKYQVPDTTAGIFYLKNRDRDNWRDQQNVEVSGSVEVKGDLREMALAMLATIKAGLLEQPKTIEGEITDEA